MGKSSERLREHTNRRDEYYARDPKLQHREQGSDRQGRSAASAATLFEEIGATSGVARSEKALRRLGIQRPRRAAASRLSERELEVARLVAEGLSNPAIAARLYLSRPTVASHVTHILTKLGFSSRNQIAAWVAGHRLGSHAG
jgi:DNA-binding NarL/FixJ family response regulator